MTTQAVRKQYPEGHDHDDASLRTGPNGFTVWSLRQMAEAKRYDELDNLFYNGVSMNALPVGMAAGAAVALLTNNDTVNEVLCALTGKLWRGKVFFSSNDKSVSQGRNRIKESSVLPNAPIVPMARFDTKLLESHPLISRPKSNFVILNYADPLTRPYLIERLVAKVPCFDIQVAVKGKYGPVYIGKTWLGKYEKNGEFTASDPNKTVAWYFLDFSDGALKEQRESHWDASEEQVLDPIPHIDN
jgi:hypothetical protein